MDYFYRVSSKAKLLQVRPNPYGIGISFAPGMVFVLDELPV